MASQNRFDRDPFPDKPRILFIGHGSSTHAHAWIDLLAGAELNVRFFALPLGVPAHPPAEWRVRTYLTVPNLPQGLDPATRRCLFPTPAEREDVKTSSAKLKRAKERKVATLIRRSIRKAKQVLRPNSVNPALPAELSPEAWLAQIVREWRPQIIHTFGLDPAGIFFYRVREQFDVSGIGTWVLQLRGGSDLTLSRFDRERTPLLSAVLKSCDQLISDNRINFRYARELGSVESQMASISPIPGTGGVDVHSLKAQWRGMPSTRHAIVIPKAYESEWSVALPVLEGMRMAWERIQPCTIHWLAMVTESTRKWYNALPADIQKNSQVYGRVPRAQVLDLMAQARVMLAPSLVDGVPNSMYEAMALGAFPIVSPLETIVPLVENNRNVLFARNLYPQEIADALVSAMRDDALVDHAAAQNLDLVERLANRNTLAPKVTTYYQRLANGM